MNNAICCRLITKRFGSLAAVNSLSLTVKSGELFGLLGPNGAGKSTLVKILVGLIKPTSGWAEVCGFPPTHVAARQQIGYLPELFRFPGWMTGIELLEFHAQLLEMPISSRRSRILEVLELTGLSEAANRRINKYSKGMQQRVGLAQAILGRPKLLFLDEPTSALDPVGRVYIRKLLQQLSNEGTTVFLNSHILTDIERICSRVAILQKGRLVKEGPLTDVLGGLSLYVELDTISSNLLTEIENRFGTVHCVNGAPKFRIELANKKLIPAVAELLVSRGHKIYQLQPVTASLEEVFLSIFDKQS
jgi:ABC-2 type transport system ATP-binding protein